MRMLTRVLGFLARMLSPLLHARLGRRRPAAPARPRLRLILPPAETSGPHHPATRGRGNQLLTLSRLSGSGAASSAPADKAEGFMQVLEQTKGDLIPFPPAARRQTRPAPAADEPRGQILLFMGVRYERQPEPGPEPTPSLSNGQPAGRRRRRQ